MWRRRWFLSRTYYLKAGDRTLYTLIRRGKKACMYNEDFRLTIDDTQAVLDETTGQRLAEADLGLNWRTVNLRELDDAISGSIRTANSITYRVTLCALEAKLLAEAGDRLVSIQGPSMTVATNQDLGDRHVAAVCLILSSFLVLGGLGS